MNFSAWMSRWLPVVSIAALSSVALLTVTLGAGRAPVPAVAAQRPAADAPVDVVRAPAAAGTRQPPCRTCELGAGRSSL